MKSVRTIVSALALSVVALSADAIVAKRDVMTVTQPDGTTLRIKKVGDEFLHFTLTEDDAILFEQNGQFTYGRVAEDGTVSSTGIKAVNAAARSTADATFITRLSDIDVAKIAEHPRVAERRASAMAQPAGRSDRSRAISQSGVGLMRNGFPNRGNVKGLVILVEYQDIKFTHPDPAQYFNDMINKPGFNEYGGTGSALDFFTQNSMGAFTPDFDVYGPITLSNKRAYYGATSGSSHDVRAYAMITEACRQLDPEVDFSQYDTDGDGEVDNVFVFYAGQGEASYGPAESVWPHAWYVYNGAGVTLFLDNVRINRYACTNEWEQARPDGVGTFIHEFSHVMGLPDLYSTSGNLSCTPGSWSCMDYGPYNNNGCTPPNYSSYERNALGWTDPIVLDKAMTITLDGIENNRCAIIPTEKNTEFYLLENRQNTGWDAYVPGHGLLIWHIDYNEGVFTRNSVNNTSSHQYVDIIEAGNVANSGSMATMASYTFPGTKGVTSFTSSTTPALKTWAGAAIDVPITGIVEEDGLVTFDVKGGGSKLDVPVLTDPQVGNDYFVVSWNPVAGATDYLLSITAQTNDEKIDECATFGSGKLTAAELPAGWTSSENPPSTYYSTANYGESMPSLKFSVNGQTLTTPEYPSDITYVSFWHRGQTSPAAMTSTVIVNGLVDGKPVKLAEVHPAGMSASTFELAGADIPAGTRQIQLEMNLQKGLIAIDDVTIKGGGKIATLGDYVNKSTGGKTQVRVADLMTGYPKYTATVKAVNDMQVTPASAPIEVFVKGMDAVDDIAVDNEADAPVHFYNLQGVEIPAPTPGTVVIERRGSKARKIIVK